MFFIRTYCDLRDTWSSYDYREGESKSSCSNQYKGSSPGTQTGQNDFGSDNDTFQKSQ